MSDGSAPPKRRRTSRPRSGTVTRIAMQARRSDRVNVELDDRFAFSLAVDLAASLSKGTVLSEDDVVELLRQDQVQRAIATGMRYLGYRPRSRQEIERHLGRKDFESQTILRACDRLEHLGYLDDAAFAEWWVNNRLEHRPRGRYALRHELRARGVPDEAIRAAVDPVDEMAAAKSLALSRSSRYRHLGRHEFDQRVGGYLARRGFSGPAIREAVSAAWSSLST